MNGPNPLIKLDALVWSFVFFEKVPRYSDEVYFIADYIDKHVKILKKISIEKIENGEFEFDIYRSEIDFKEKLIKLNGYLTPEEFAEEEKSERKIKKYHYNYKEI